MFNLPVNFSLCTVWEHWLNLTFLWPCIVSIFTSHNQQDATFLNYLFLQMLYMFQVVPPSSSGAQKLYIQLQVLSTNTAVCCYHGWDGTACHLVHDTSKQQYWLTIPEAVCAVLCSWWWAEEPPETCRAPVEIKNQETLHLVGCISTLAASSSIGWQYLKLYVQFLCSWWWEVPPPETCTASVEINK